MPITINADDYGKSEEINRAICEAFGNGYISTTTLMANMPGVATAYDLARENGFVDKVGIHLNITEGIPLTEGIRNNPLICDMDGKFNAAFYHNTKYRLYMDRLAINQIKEELDAQISMFLSLGFTNLHVDSHHHVHTNLPVFTAVKELSDKYKYDYMRLGRNLYHGGSVFNNVYKSLYNSSVKRLAKNTTQYFGSYRDYMTYFGLNPDRPADRAKSLTTDMKRFNDSKSVEIMVHPMYAENGSLVDTDILMSDESTVLMV